MISWNVTINAARMVIEWIATPFQILKQNPCWDTLQVQRKQSATKILVKNLGQNLIVETKFSNCCKECKSCQNCWWKLNNCHSSGYLFNYPKTVCKKKKSGFNGTIDNNSSTKSCTHFSIDLVNNFTEVPSWWQPEIKRSISSWSALRGISWSSNYKRSRYYHCN